MRQVATDCAALGLTEIARTVCELLDWTRPTGRLKTHECRQLLARLHARGLLVLPPLRPTGPQGPRRVAWTAASDPPPPITGRVRDVGPLGLTVVDCAEDRALWTELVDRYHYLRFRVPVGAQLRYLVRATPTPSPVLACLLWTSAAWTMAARDRWIGWTPQQRARNLGFVVNNSRFLILPWVRVPHLASAILARAARQLPDDWEAAYATRPLLLETLVDTQRFAGTCYKAANWQLLGDTQGRGRMDRQHARHGAAPKRVFVYPLVRHVQHRLCQTTPPVTGSGVR
ncbi:MAG: DUF4338 domain-containing protein [Alphaproteobacteria bacterium]